MLSKVHRLIQEAVETEMSYYQDLCSRELVECKYLWALDLLKSIPGVNLNMELKFIIQDLARGTFHTQYELSPNEKRTLTRIGIHIFCAEYPDPVYIMKQTYFNDEDNEFLHEYISRFKDLDAKVDPMFTLQDCIDSFKN